MGYSNSRRGLERGFKKWGKGKTWDESCGKGRGKRRGGERGSGGERASGGEARGEWSGKWRGTLEKRELKSVKDIGGKSKSTL